MRRPRRVATRGGLWLLAAVIGCTDSATVDRPTHDIELTPVAEFRGVGDSVDVAQGLPGITSAGTVVAPLYASEQGAFAAFAADGRYLRRAGPTGRGPGEISQLGNVLVGPGDSVWTLDRNRRINVYTPPPELRYVRSFQTSLVSTSEATPFGILSRGLVTGDGLVHPTLSDWSGEPVAKFGASVSPERPEDRMGAVTAVDRDSIWVGLPDAYRLELLASDGARVRAIERSVDWFPTDLAERQELWRVRPPPRIDVMSRDADGYLWVLIRRGNRNWTQPGARGGLARKAVPNAPMPASTRRPPDLNITFETVLEVLDPHDGRLLASRELPGGAIGFPAPGLLWQVTMDSLGHVTGQLSRLSLRALNSETP